MRNLSVVRHLSLVACLGASASMLPAQNSILVFSPVNVRVSASGSSVSNPVAFNSATINLSCGTAPATAMLSSTPNGQGNILVDNNVLLTVNSSNVPTAGVNVCRGGTSDSTPSGSSPNCFTSDYGNNAANLVGQNPDTFMAISGGGVAPIDISSNLQAALGGQPGAIQVKIDLIDQGGYLASSSIYLNTSCTQQSATGPAVITGNPISSTNPTPSQLDQSANFDSTTNQQIQFTYDLRTAQNAGTLSIVDGTIPQVTDNPLDPATFQSTLVHDTSFSTSQCLIHTGESINSQPACKLFTLECSVGTGSTATGAQCPVSSLPNEIFADVFDGPPFSLPDINTPAGQTFHQGIGFLMASEGWTGGPCQFDPAANLQTVLCPQNLLTSFSGPGLYSALGGTSHPNSTFVPIVQVPEDLTTLMVAGQRTGGWINSSTAALTLSSQPPNLTGTNIPGAATFVASPIQSITYGISAASNVPQPTAPATSPADTVLNNPVACPDPANPASVPATVFTPAPQTLGGLADGQYLVHYFAQDCAGTQELKFTQDQNQSWSTNYYTFPINVDTVAPSVTSGPVLNQPAPSGGYVVGQTVTASYSCTDDRSGLVQCGASSYSVSATSPTTSSGPLTSAVDTSTPGNKTFTVVAMDAAGNQTSSSVSYMVVPAYSAAIHVTVQTPSVVYPGGSNVVIQVAAANGHTATGSVQLLDGTTVLQTSTLGGGGAAYLYVQGLSAGTHSLSASYSGDGFHPAGNSAPVTLTVTPAPVKLIPACWNPTFQYGADYHCGVTVSSPAGAPLGNITYSYDGAAPVTVALGGGKASFAIPLPQTGTHSVQIGYAAQTNYAAATPQTQSFTVSRAAVVVTLTPSTFTLTGGSLTLTAAVQSPSAGPPNQVGTVSFVSNGTLLATVPVNASGVATTTVAPGALPSGHYTIAANYSGSTNYAPGSASVKVTVQ